MDHIVQLGDQVTLNCEGQLVNGHKITSSKKDGPLAFKVGEFPVIKGINNAVLGMRIGENRNITLNAGEAFGDYDPKKVVRIQLKSLPVDVAVGSKFKDEDENLWFAKEIDESEGIAVLDGNHMLAGEELILNLEVIAIRKD